MLLNEYRGADPLFPYLECDLLKVGSPSPRGSLGVVGVVRLTVPGLNVLSR